MHELEVMKAECRRNPHDMGLYLALVDRIEEEEGVCSEEARRRAWLVWHPAHAEMTLSLAGYLVYSKHSHSYPMMTWLSCINDGVPDVRSWLGITYWHDDVIRPMSLDLWFDSRCSLTARKVWAPGLLRRVNRPWATYCLLVGTEHIFRAAERLGIPFPSRPPAPQFQYHQYRDCKYPATGTAGSEE